MKQKGFHLKLPRLWDAVFDADADGRQYLDDPFDGRLVGEGEEDRSWTKGKTRDTITTCSEKEKKRKKRKKRKKGKGLTSAGQKDLDGHILQQVAASEDGSYLRKIPFAVKIIAVL